MAVLFLAHTAAFSPLIISHSITRMNEGALVLRRHPGFGSAKTVLLSHLAQGNWVSRRIRVVGS